MFVLCEIMVFHMRLILAYFLNNAKLDNPCGLFLLSHLLSFALTLKKTNRPAAFCTCVCVCVHVWRCISLIKVSVSRGEEVEFVVSVLPI